MTGAVRTVAAIGSAGYACLQWWGRTCGSTWRERQQSMPGDDLVRCPQTVGTHAMTIPASPDQVWPWLAQVGWHRVAWYTARRVDALSFPANAPSADRVLLAHQYLEVGDCIPDGPPETGCGFNLVVIPADFVMGRDMLRGMRRSAGHMGHLRGDLHAAVR